MAAGDPFSSSQLAEIDRAIRSAETACRFEFSVFVGASDGESHPFALRLHAAIVIANVVGLAVSAGLTFALAPDLGAEGAAVANLRSIRDALSTEISAD